MKTSHYSGKHTSWAKKKVDIHEGKLKNNIFFDEYVIIMDFKENMRLGHGLNKTKTDFYKKTQISV